MDGFAIRLGLEEKEEGLSFNDIKNELKETSEQIKRAETRFNFLTDENLIEAQIYELRALRARYSYYLKLARAFGEKGK